LDHARPSNHNTEVVDLKGKTLLPGFIECHQNASVAATNKFDICTVGNNLKEHDKTIIALEIISNKVSEALRPELFLGTYSWDLMLK